MPPFPLGEVLAPHTWTPKALHKGTTIFQSRSASHHPSPVLHTALHTTSFTLQWRHDLWHGDFCLSTCFSIHAKRSSSLCGYLWLILQASPETFITPGISPKQCQGPTEHCLVPFLPWHSPHCWRHLFSCRWLSVLWAGPTSVQYPYFPCTSPAQHIVGVLCTLNQLFSNFLTSGFL